jgi:hypothetical protein
MLGFLAFGTAPAYVPIHCTVCGDRYCSMSGDRALCGAAVATRSFQR